MRPERDYHDKFNIEPADLRLDDLPPRSSAPARLTVMMSANNFRANQLARSLEGLARQRMRAFQVLVCDNGCKQPLAPIISRFEPYLNIECVRLERSEFYSCPSTGLKALLHKATGEIIAIMQPEMLLLPSATHYLLVAHEQNLTDVARYKISTSRASMAHRATWVNLKPATLSEKQTLAIDAVDWHSDMRGAIEGLPDFLWHEQNFAQLNNDDIEARHEFPFWFAASAHREAEIWEDLPTFKGHATIDMWLMNYRNFNEYVDLCPRQRQGYHQAHLRTSIAPDGEQEAATIRTPPAAAHLKPMGMDELRRWLEVYGEPGDGDEETLWRRLSQAREKDRESGKYRQARMGLLHGQVVVRRDGGEASARIRRLRGG